MECVTIFVRGQVQGVGFRWWATAQARQLALAGHARNAPDGRVEIVAQGQRQSLERLEELLREEPSSTARPGRVESVVVQEAKAAEGRSEFVEK